MIYNQARLALNKVMPVLQKTINYRLENNDLKSISFSVGEYKFDNNEMFFYVIYDGNKGCKIYFRTIFAPNSNNEPCLFGDSISELQILGASAATAERYTKIVEKHTDWIGLYQVSANGELRHHFGFLLPNISNEAEFCVYMHQCLTACIMGASVSLYASKLS